MTRLVGARHENRLERTLQQVRIRFAEKLPQAEADYLKKNGWEHSYPFSLG